MAAGTYPRVMMVVRQYWPWIGGIERQSQRLATKLIELGANVQVVTGWWYWGTPQRTVVGRVPVFRNFAAWNMFGIRGLRKFAGYTYLLTLFGYLSRQRDQYDLIHVMLLSYHAWPAVIAARRFGKKSVITLGNSGSRSDVARMQRNDMLPGQRQMLPLTLKADCLVGLSHTMTAELRAAGVPSQRIERIPTGIEIAGRPTHDYALNGKVNVIFVGRLNPIKGLGTLLPAFAKARQLRPDLDWQLWLLGEGPLRSALQASAAELGLAEAVKFCGAVSDVPAYLDRADIFVLPSKAEGLSNALQEAMTAGLPCIASRVGGNPELIIPDDSGLLVTSESETELVDALLSLAANEDLRRRIGRRAQQTISEAFSLDHVARRYLGLYQRLLQPEAPEKHEVDLETASCQSEGQLKRADAPSQVGR
jgi:glycosyltransferase involved in cell wall biosynthesis